MVLGGPSAALGIRVSCMVAGVDTVEKLLWVCV